MRRKEVYRFEGGLSSLLLVFLILLQGITSFF